MVQKGDKVRFLNAVGGGEVTRVQGNIIYVQDEDGFEVPVLAREVVVTTPAGDSRAVQSADKAAGVSENTLTQSTQPHTSASSVAPVIEEEPFEETPQGEKLNVVLAYEALNLKKLSDSEYEASLVNDSNYYLLFTYMTLQDSTGKWLCRYAGRVEPGIQLLLGALTKDEISDISRVAVQYVAYKDDDKPFDAKTPARVEYRFDGTKFFKLHCFRENEYFDEPVIAYDIVRNDVPCADVVVDERSLQRAMREKTVSDQHRTRRPVVKKTKPSSNVLEVDLHIHELVDNTNGLSKADMLNLQIDKFRAVMDENLRNHGKKIVFIHGKGEGVLRQAILKELNHRYKNHDVQDASFREYGFGATQVTIR